MLIFGLTTKVFQLAMLNLICTFCGNPSAQALRRRVTKFTLFFIPLFTTRRRYLRTCAYCGVTAELSKSEKNALA